MTSLLDPVTLSWERSMQAFEPREWNALAQGCPPFLRWEWLDLLERSGSVCPDTGWVPLHCAVRGPEGLVGAAPLYAKGHSEGEFVYDRLWADLARQLGVAYFPKLVAASPFSPVAGYRFLTHPAPRYANLPGAMLSSMLRLAQENDLSSLHVLFAQEDFADQLVGLGLETWEHQGFLWENDGFRDFEDFLSTMRSGPRTTIRKERKRLAAAGVTVRVVDGVDAPEEWFSLMYRLYEDTNDKFGEWGCKYLTREFFLGLAHEALRPHVAFCAAFEPGVGTPVGLALLARDEHTLYGRYWGAEAEIPFLHFELCYYAPMEWAIAKGLRAFDPGMGGEHKPRRGFRSRVTRSAHRFFNPALARVFTRHIPQLNEIAWEHIQQLESMCPFKNG